MTRGADAYITSDVNQHQMWAAQFYKFDEPRRWINSGGAGTMGVGLPFAVGIKIAWPDSEVFCITGEGSIQMNIQELATCKHYDAHVKIIALNNRYLGMVRQWQQIEYSSRYSHTYMDALPDFVKLAQAYGHVGMLIERPQDVEPRLTRSAQAARPHRLSRHPHRPHGKRLSHGARRARHHGNDAENGRGLKLWPASLRRGLARRAQAMTHKPAARQRKALWPAPAAFRGTRHHETHHRRSH